MCTTEKLRNLFSVLVVYRHNMQMLHWRVVGPAFDAVHELCDNYTDRFNKMIDSVGEKLLIMGDTPCTLFECLEIVKNLPREFICVEPRDYCDIECFENIHAMLDSLIKEYNLAIDDCRCSSCTHLPKGARASLESDLEWLELECYYKNTKRLVGKKD